MDEYYPLMEELLLAMTDLEGMDLDKVFTALKKLCRLFRVCKGLTQFFPSIRAEKEGHGEDYVCPVTGEDGHVVLKERVVTAARTVACVSVFMPDDAEPWTDLERERVRLVTRTILSLMSRSRLQRIVAQLTNYDAENYPSLRFFFSRLEVLAEEDKLSGMAAMHFNLKHFSVVNRRIGRQAASEVMRGYIDQLTAMVGEEGVVCRLGGDNFVALCPQSQLEGVLAHLRGAPIETGLAQGGSGRVMVSASAGILLIPETVHPKGPDEIMEKIMTAGQIARTSSRQDILFYNAELAERREQAKRLEQVFPQALAREEFLVYYQPKVDVTTGRLVGAEALCRWNHHGRIVPPLEFVPILEQSMEICKLDFYVLDQVCRALRRWLDEGRDPIRVSVNLSRRHMADLDLYTHILEIVDRYQVPRKYLEVELTETTTDVEFKDLKRVVQSLQEAGISTSVDDFGVGYSSLNLLKEIPWNVIKIDRSILPTTDESGAARQTAVMLKAVVAMTRELGLECMAEGVETREQLEILREVGCGVAQGYLFDRPLPQAEFEDRMTRGSYPLP